MENNSTFNITLSLIAILFFTQAGTSNAQLANIYPNDSLINSDSNVVFTEMFEHSTVNAMITSTTPNYQTSPMLSH
ncbi:MAG: hypothetical protein ACKVQV_16555, partial [Bacteroidia bacterium]